MFSKPVINVAKIEHLSKRDLGLNKSVIRVCNRYIDASKQDRNKFMRNMSVAVINRDTKKKIVATIRGDNRTKEEGRLQSDQIALDYDSRDLLGLNKKPQNRLAVNVTVRPAHWWEVYTWYWSHPDPGYKISTRLALVSLMLGGISLLQTIISTFL